MKLDAGHSSKKVSGWGIFFLVWLVLALLAFPAALYCAIERHSDDPNADTIGILLSFFAGPLYWLWFFFKGGYCMRK
jgi:hypothetical protein